MEISDTSPSFQKLVEKYRWANVIAISAKATTKLRTSPRKTLAVSYDEDFSSINDIKTKASVTDSTPAVGSVKRRKSVVKLEDRDEPEPLSSVKKKKKPSRPYADPSVYAHLPTMAHWLKEGLDVIMVGINPGVMSAQLNQHYANPTNHFYKCLHGAKFTERRLLPSEGILLPELYGIGSTNLNPRPTAEASELSKQEMRACVPSLLQRLLKYRPRMVCFVGMEICAYVRWYLSQLPVSLNEVKKDAKEVKYDTSENGSTLDSPKRKKKAAGKVQNGLQPFAISFTSSKESGKSALLYFYVVPSTSARVVYYQLEDKVKIWKDLKMQIDMLKATPTQLLELPTPSTIYPVESLLAFMDKREYNQEIGPFVRSRNDFLSPNSTGTEANEPQHDHNLIKQEA